MTNEEEPMTLTMVKWIAHLCLQDGVSDDAEEMHLSVRYVKSQGSPTIQFRVVPHLSVGTTPASNQDVVPARNLSQEERQRRSDRMKQLWADGKMKRITI